MREIITVVFLFTCPLLFGQSFYVSFVKGHITKSGVPLKIGDILQANDTEALEFGTMHDAVVVVNAKKGRFVIKPKIVQKSQNRFWVLVKDNLVPCTQKNSLTTRASDKTLDINEFLHDGRFSILDTFLIPLDKTFWGDRQNNFFYISYDFKGEKIEKRLPFMEPLNENDVLKLIIGQDIFIADQTPVQYSEISNMALCFYEKDISQSIKIKDIEIVPLWDKAVWSGLEITFSAMEEFFDHDDSLLQNDLKSHIWEFYGKLPAGSIPKVMEMLRKKSGHN